MIEIIKLEPSGSNLKPLTYIFRLSTLLGISPLNWSQEFSWPCLFYNLSPSVILGYFIYRLAFKEVPIYAKYKSSANASIMKNSYIVLSFLELALYLNIFIVSFIKSSKVKRFFDEFNRIENSLFQLLIDIGYKKPIYKIIPFYFILTVFITRFAIVTTIFHDFRPLEFYKIFLEQYLLRAYIHDAQFLMFLDILSNHFNLISLTASSTRSMRVMKDLGKAHNSLCSLGDDIVDYYSTHCMFTVAYNSLSILYSCHAIIVELTNIDDSGLDVYLISVNIGVNMLLIYLISSFSNELQNKSQEFPFELGHQLIMDFPRPQKMLHSKIMMKAGTFRNYETSNINDYANAILEMDRSVVVTAWGFFELNNTLIVSIATAVLTYVVVLQQFINAEISEANKNKTTDTPQLPLKLTTPLY